MADTGAHSRAQFSPTLRYLLPTYRWWPVARVVELVDTAGLGPAAARFGGSSPFTRTKSGAQLYKPTSKIAESGDYDFAWRGLRKFHDSAALTERLMQDRKLPPKQKPNVLKQMQQLGYCLSQAYEFSTSARASGAATKALQAYYSATSLANAEILWLGDGLDSIDGRPSKYHSHGLTLVQANELDALSAQPDPTDGLFGLWRGRARHAPPYSKVENQKEGEASHSAIRAEASGSALADMSLPDRPIKLTDCFRHIPGLHSSLDAPFRSRLVRGHVTDRFRADANGKFKSIQIDTVLHPGIEENIQGVVDQWKYPPALVPHVTIVPASSGLIFSLKLDAATAALGYQFKRPEMFLHRTDEAFFVGEGEFLNEFGYFYVGLFILGMIVRYHPQKWMGPVSKGALMTILSDEFIDLSLRRLPLLVLGTLTDRITLYE